MSSNIILTLNLEEDSILLNEGILNALDWPRQIQLLINPETKQLVLRACSVGAAQAVVIEADEEQQCEISGRALLKKISHLVGWEVHEMARDEARHGKGFEGLLKRYFG